MAVLGTKLGLALKLWATDMHITAADYHSIATGIAYRLPASLLQPPRKTIATCCNHPASHPASH